MLIFKLIELMDKFKKIFLSLLELEETDPRALKNQEISKMVNMKNSMVHTNLNTDKIRPSIMLWTVWKA